MRIKLNKKQQQALLRKWNQDNNGMTYLQFRRTVEAAVGMDCAMVQWGHMWIGIELDGYTHS